MASENVLTRLKLKLLFGKAAEYQQVALSSFITVGILMILAAPPRNPTYSQSSHLISCLSLCPIMFVGFPTSSILAQWFSCIALLESQFLPC